MTLSVEMPFEAVHVAGRRDARPVDLGRADGAVTGATQENNGPLRCADQRPPEGPAQSRRGSRRCASRRTSPIRHRPLHDQGSDKSGITDESAIPPRSASTRPPAAEHFPGLKWRDISGVAHCVSLAHLAEMQSSRARSRAIATRVRWPAPPQARGRISRRRFPQDNERTRSAYRQVVRRRPPPACRSVDHPRGTRRDHQGVHRRPRDRPGLCSNTGTVTQAPWQHTAHRRNTPHRR